MNIKQIPNKVKQTIEKYKLCSKKDKVLVALSGGKDSSSVLYLLKKFGYKVEGFHINLGISGYSERCLDSIRKLCDELDVKLHVYEMRKEQGGSMCYIRTGVQSKEKLNNCAVCGVVKKWVMNKEARKLKADKIATGHNLDDEAQTVLMNFFKGNLDLSINSKPIVGVVVDKKFVPRIKPLFFIPEDDVRTFALDKKIEHISEPCPCALDSYRIKTRKFLNTVDGKEKLNIVNNNLEMMKDKKVSSEVKYCEVCGEPSRGEICKKCKMLGSKI
ncbi:MAG: adenine nucleotide alpha hydrolase family protein [Nanoarchaeota archaeon]|nr:adenine nucleotide alpha hydrolase family protein [Nanoarchaeota archaeon]